MEARDILEKMIKRGVTAGYDKRSLEFAAGYMIEDIKVMIAALKAAQKAMVHYKRNERSQS